MASNSWLMESNDSKTNYWEEDEQQRQESVLLQLEDPEERLKVAVEREQQIGSIVQSIADLKYIFKVNDIIINRVHIYQIYFFFLHDILSFQHLFLIQERKKS